MPVPYVQIMQPPFGSARLHFDSALICDNKKEKEVNVLFNNALNTFYLRLYGIRHMVKDHSDSERGNPLPPHGLPILINNKGSFMSWSNIPHRIAHTTAIFTPVVMHWQEQEIAQWVIT